MRAIVYDRPGGSDVAVENGAMGKVLVDVTEG
jgi:hypothetical protein